MLPSITARSGRKKIVIFDMMTDRKPRKIVRNLFPCGKFPCTVANYSVSFHKSWFLEIDKICICFAVILDTVRLTACIAVYITKIVLRKCS